MRRVYRLEFAVRIDLPKLLLHIHELLVVKIIAAKIVEQQETASVEVLAKILRVARKKIQESGFGNIRERILKQLFAVDVHNLIRLRGRIRGCKTRERNRQHRIAIR